MGEYVFDLVLDPAGFGEAFRVVWGEEELDVFVVGVGVEVLAEVGKKEGNPDPTEGSEFGSLFEES